MVIGRPRSYDCRVNITTNTESDLYKLGRDRFGITASEALTCGYIGKIDAIISVQKNVTEEELNRYLEIRNRVFKTYVLEIEKEEEAAKRVSDFSEDIRKTISCNVIESGSQEDRDPLHHDVLSVMGHDIVLMFAERYRDGDESAPSQLVSLYLQQPNNCPVVDIELGTIRTWFLEVVLNGS